MDCQPSPSKFLSKQEVADLLDVSTRSIERWVRLGSFPKPAFSTCRTRRWKIEEVLQWKNTSATDRDTTRQDATNRN